MATHLLARHKQSIDQYVVNLSTGTLLPRKHRPNGLNGHVGGSEGDEDNNSGMFYGDTSLSQQQLQADVPSSSGIGGNGSGNGSGSGSGSHNYDSSSSADADAVPTFSGADNNNNSSSNNNGNKTSNYGYEHSINDQQKDYFAGSNDINSNNNYNTNTEAIHSKNGSNPTIEKIDKRKFNRGQAHRRSYR